MNAPGRLVLVLGMHRSGTSTLARGLRVLGVALGKNLLPAHPCNPKGFFEDAGLYAFNKALLAQLGLTWRSPEAPDTAALRRLAAGPPGVTALSLLREKSAGQAIPGLKDPRMSRLLPFWRPVLAASGLRAHCCIALRHPESVAHSLWQRDRLDAEHSHALWLAYLLDALEGSAGLPRLLTDYGLLLHRPERQLQRLGHFLDLPLDPAELTLFADDFLDKTLCHHSPAPANDAVRESPGGAWAALALRLYAALAPAAAASPEHQALDEPRLGRLVASLRREAAATAAPVSQEPRP
ncbi:MAG: glycosyl transferase family 1 [Desulfovibrio sp.]|uniref:sulfotransferase family protein n=1 Tax=Desulfovibrio sp. TaxID=885 RepID=UPI0025BF2CED|nr:glycosyl transferase family 1 [Desulfovibrio sp.]MBS6829742.1 glycosyl transferase family 1 [Desulfovibrio sp.]